MKTRCSETGCLPSTDKHTNMNNMKTKRITAIALIALGAMTSSCKKQEPEPVVSNNCTEPTECSFCPGEEITLDANGMVNEVYAHQVSFFHEDGQEVQPVAPIDRTPSGFYDLHEGMSIEFNTAELPIACTANKITFVHARFANNTNDHPNLVNVKFPTTPLIVCPADSLAQYLAPYGYQAQHFYLPGYVNMSNSQGFTGVIDSLIITGPDFQTVTVGANLFESELRSICIAHQ
jgi:hypothetical protein